MENKSQVFNLCPECIKQNKRTPLEADEGSNIVKCEIHGDISLKYFNDIINLKA
jgi:hypothetical protein